MRGEGGDGAAAAADSDDDVEEVRLEGVIE